MTLLAQSDWVVWDTGYLDRFFSILKSYIGPAVSIGILAFAIVFGISLVVRVIRRFTR